MHIYIYIFQRIAIQICVDLTYGVMWSAVSWLCGAIVLEHGTYCCMRITHGAASFKDSWFPDFREGLATDLSANIRRVERRLSYGSLRTTCNSLWNVFGVAVVIAKVAIPPRGNETVWRFQLLQHFNSVPSLCRDYLKSRYVFNDVRFFFIFVSTMALLNRAKLSRSMRYSCPWHPSGWAIVKVDGVSRERGDLLQGRWRPFLLKYDSHQGQDSLRDPCKQASSSLRAHWHAKTLEKLYWCPFGPQ